MPDFSYERHCWRDGYHLVAGIDEAGRGALAGPIVAAAVVFRTGSRRTRHLNQIDDSKRLTAQRRTELVDVITSTAVAWAVGEASSVEIDQLGISRANRLCMERALDGLQMCPDLVLLDAITTESHLPQIGLIDGDALSISIAAASILAKTSRDNAMHRLHSEFHAYGFDHHVGYGTSRHLSALQEFGPCAHHRLTFAGVVR
jgi:ribonuclease HII